MNLKLFFELIELHKSPLHLFSNSIYIICVRYIDCVSIQSIDI